MVVKKMVVKMMIEMVETKAVQVAVAVEMIAAVGIVETKVAVVGEMIVYHLTYFFVIRTSYFAFLFAFVAD